jgi:hypothetical protein
VYLQLHHEVKFPWFHQLWAFRAVPLCYRSVGVVPSFLYPWRSLGSIVLLHLYSVVCTGTQNCLCFFVVKKVKFARKIKLNFAWEMFIVERSVGLVMYW